MRSIPREQRIWWVVGTVGVTIGVVLAVWFGISASRGITWTDAGHNVVDDRHIQVRFDVVDTSHKPVRCTIKAQSADHAVVGRATQTFPASPHDSTRRVVTLRTTERAVTGTVDTCESA